MKNDSFCRKFLCFAMGLIFTCAFQGCVTQNGAGPSSEEVALTRSDSWKLRKTILAEHIEQPMVKGKNVIYCASFQLAWNELRDDIVKEPITLLNEPALVPFLNDSPLNFETIGEDPNFFAMAGYGRDGIVKKINQELAQRDASPLNVSVEPDDILSYAYMDKVLSFRLPFEKLKKHPIRFGGRRTVKSFGVDSYSLSREHRNMIEQVWLLHLRPEEPANSQAFDSPINDRLSPEEFAVRIKTDSPTDQLILAMVEPKETLLETIQSIENRREPDKDTILPLERESSFAVPDIAFNIRHEFPSLKDGILTNEMDVVYMLRECLQDTLFRLNREGVELKSEARIGIVTSSAHVPSISYRFDKPFLLYMKKKDAEYPYFAVWIANEQLLIKD